MGWDLGGVCKRYPRMRVHEDLGPLGCGALLCTAEPMAKDLPSGRRGHNHACEHPEEKPSGQAALPLPPLGIRCRLISIRRCFLIYGNGIHSAKDLTSVGMAIPPS